MKIGIIAPSNANLYATTLLAALRATQRDVRSVLCLADSAWSRFMAYRRLYGWSAALRRASQQCRIVPDDADRVRCYLQQLGEQHQWSDWDEPLAAQCRQSGIPFMKVASVNDPAAVAEVRRRGLDVVISAVAEIYRAEMIAAPRLGLLNAHMAILPAFRGMNVLEWSVFEDQPIGVTIHLVAEAVDTGGIILTRTMSVGRDDTLETLRARSIALNVELMREALERLDANPSVPKPIDPALGRQYFVMHPRLRRVVERKVLATRHAG